MILPRLPGIILILLMLGLFHAAGAYQKPDWIPRARAVTDQELFSSLDLTLPALAEVQNALKSSDTTNALKALAEYFGGHRSRVYFFDPSTVQERVNTFASEYPQQVRAILAGASRFKRTYGQDVDWQVPGKNLHGRPHTPNTVRLLARQWYAENIALSHFLEDEKSGSIDFLMNHVKDFVADYEAGKAESGGNDIFERFYAGHRARNWLLMHHLLLGSPDYRWEDQTFMLKVFLLHGARLVDQSRKFNWGNHQLHGLCALYEMSLMYPEFPVMKEWNTQALKLILEHMEKEVPPDGFQFERASHYHKLDMINYFRVYRISELNGVSLPGWYLSRFKKMFDAVAALAMPTKSLPVLQDGQDAQQNRENDVNAGTPFGLVQAYTDAAEFPEPQEALFMSLGAFLFQEPQFKFFGSDRFPAAWYWFLDADAAKRYADLKTSSPAIGSVGLKETGYYVMRTGWKTDDLYMLIDGGLAQYKPDHTHGGILGVILYARGQVLLPTYHVRYSDPSYQILKNSLVKNVALADTMLQGRYWRPNKAQTGFGIWLQLPKPVVHAWEAEPDYDYFRGSHNAFDSIGVKYSRSILFIKPYYWLVLDDFDSPGLHSYQQIWQGDYRLTQEAGEAVQEGKSGVRLRILQPSTDAASMSLHTIAGKKAVWIEKDGKSRVSFATLLVPGRVSEEIPVSFTAGNRPGSYTVTYADREDRITRHSEDDASELTVERMREGKPVSAITVGKRDKKSTTEETE